MWFLGSRNSSYHDSPVELGPGFAMKSICIVFMCVIQELDYLAARKAGMKSLLLIRDKEKQVNI